MDKSKRLDEFVAALDELLAKFPDDSNPALAVLRERIDAEIFEAWTTISRARNHEVRARAAGHARLLAGSALIAAVCAAFVVKARPRARTYA